MTKRYRITRIKKGAAQSGQTLVELYAQDTRLKYPVLYLFDLAELAAVGIDPNDLGEEMVHCNFWAYYELSDKLNGQGNPYKDLVALEPIQAPASIGAGEKGAILEELRAIRALLQQLAGGDSSVGSPAAFDSPSPPPERRPDSVGQTNTAADPQATDPPLSPAQARRRFHDLAGPAIAEGRIAPQRVNELARQAEEEGWPEALAELKDRLA